jgi:hypothetical protein
LLSPTFFFLLFPRDGYPRLPNHQWWVRTLNPICHVMSYVAPCHEGQLAKCRAGSPRGQPCIEWDDFVHANTRINTRVELAASRCPAHANSIILLERSVGIRSRWSTIQLLKRKSKPVLG